jgi:two-component system, NtrC family, response regulator AtoC
VLLADRDEKRRTRIQLFLDRRGYEATSAASPPASGGRGGEPAAFDLLFCDLQALSRLDAAALGGPYVVVVAGASERERVGDALASGAPIDDCLIDPQSEVELDLALRRARRSRPVAPERRRRGADRQRPGGFGGMIGDSPAMAQVYDLVARVAGHGASVLITGESGTGKELVARAIHDRSARKGAFVALNCGAIPGSLLESELFGYKKGAFTDAIRDKTGLVQEADGGTLFLDEIGEMPADLQVKLLRVLQESEIRPLGGSQSLRVDVRVVAATVRDLAAEVASGSFRQDLFFRLNVLPIHMPPLRDRLEDIPALARHFLGGFAARHGLDPSAVEITEEALARLAGHDWPGNVRELENTIERALVLADGGRIDEQALGQLSRQAASKHPLAEVLAADELSIKRATRAVEAALIRRALEITSGNRTNAAKLLEISHRALLYKIKEYGLQDA